MYRPANTVVAVAGDLDHAEAVDLAAAAFGTGNGAVPGLRPGAGPARRRAGPRSASARRRRPSSSSGCRRCVATIPTAGPWRVLNAVLGDGMSSRLFLSVREERGLAYDISSGLVDYADAGALEISAGVDPDGLPRGARRDPRRARPAARRARPAPTSWPRPSATSPGGLELRMDETRHVASWIGGQEALHDRVLTLEEALDAIDGGRRRRRPGAGRRAIDDDGLRLAAVAPARHLRGLERACGCRT